MPTEVDRIHIETWDLQHICAVLSCLKRCQIWLTCRRKLMSYDEVALFFWILYNNFLVSSVLHPKSIVLKFEPSITFCYGDRKLTQKQTSKNKNPSWVFTKHIKSVIMQTSGKLRLNVQNKSIKKICRNARDTAVIWTYRPSGLLFWKKWKQKSHF